ncbi:MAG: hypothetical protein ACRED9_15295 [Caulobacteraceae bacterium]
MPRVRWRRHGHRPAPQPIRLPVPGWGGEPQPRADGSHEQIWHCTPFSEAARYGVEVRYPFDAELRVRRFRGKVKLEADWGEPEDPEMMWPPFRTFGENFYSHQIALDLTAGPGWAILTGPHPRVWADPTDSTPVAVPALIRAEWWPMMFFCIFKAPPFGHVHVFRKGEPYMMLTVVPAEPELDLQEMDEEEAAQREMQARRLAKNRDALAEGTRWTSTTKTIFDGTYRHMLRAAKARGRG